MLLATLRYLASGMKWDICLALDIGFGSYWGGRGVIWPTICALDCLTDYEIGLLLNEEAEMEKIAEEFAGMCICHYCSTSPYSICICYYCTLGIVFHLSSAFL